MFIRLIIKKQAMHIIYQQKAQDALQLWVLYLFFFFIVVTNNVRLRWGRREESVNAKLLPKPETLVGDESCSRCQMRSLDCAVNQTEQILLQVLIMKTITLLRRREMMRITTLLSWKGDANINWKSSQAANFPALTYPPKTTSCVLT